LQIFGHPIVNITADERPYNSLAPTVAYSFWTTGPTSFGQSRTTRRHARGVCLHVHPFSARYALLLPVRASTNAWKKGCAWTDAGSARGFAQPSQAQQLMIRRSCSQLDWRAWCYRNWPWKWWQAVKSLCILDRADRARMLALDGETVAIQDWQSDHE
jgi:hypothetical protein